VPQAQSSRLSEDVSSFGFSRVIELPHAKTIELDNGLRLTSYHFGMVLDSCLVIDDGRTTLMDMNDCKLTRGPLRQVLTRHPKIDFLFRSHSSASSYPFCVTAEDESELSYRTPLDYSIEFTASAAFAKARYAVPFASNHCYMHKETYQFNPTVVSPVEVKAYFDEHRPAGSECVVMIPGDSWDERKGFSLQPEAQDYFVNREAHLRAYATELDKSMQAYYREEDAVDIAFDAFAEYFRAFATSLPWLVRRVFSPIVAFERSGREGAWIVDFGSRRVFESASAPERAALVVQVHSAVLKDCVEKRMFSVFTASKRLHVRVAKGRMGDFFMLTTLLDMYEYGYFPLRRCFNPRFAMAWLRRWREVVMYAGMATRMILARGRDPLAIAIPRTE
jgi:UDP-MurNAc hydroxylase